MRGLMDFLRPRAVTLLVLLLIALASTWVHWRVLHTSYSHPDEVIAKSVVTKVLATKKKDTNWARTDVIELFHYNQFNFSSYYLAAAKIEKVVHHRGADIANETVLIGHLRQQNVVFAGLIALLAGLLAWRISNPLGAVLGSLLTATCVTLFQDSIYARPEAFVTILTLLFVFVLLSRFNRWAMLGLSGLLLGILIATKITFLMFLPFPLLVLSARAHATATPGQHTNPHPWQITGAVLLFFACIFGGFALGAPYAVLAPWEYLEGVGYLLRQYGAGQWPQGMNGGGALGRLGQGIAYLLYTEGVIVPGLAIAGIVLLLRQGRHAMVLACAGPLLSLLYFLQTRAFFERNFSHALPIVFALAGVGMAWMIAALGDWLSRRRWQSDALRGALVTAAVLLTIFAPYAVSAKLYHVLVEGDDSLRVMETTQRKVSHDGAIPVIWLHSDIGAIANARGSLCGEVIYKLIEFGDADAQQRLIDLTQRGYHIDAHLHGPFDGAPLSTLQTYHAANVVFLHGPPDAADNQCKAELIGLKLNPAYVDINTPVVLSSGWTQGGYPPDMQFGDWTRPFYASWSGSDANTGDMTIGPFEACGDVIVPFAIGPTRHDLELAIDRDVGSTHESILLDAPPPTVTLSAIRIPHADRCATYTIKGKDHGAGWGQWLGVGMPAELPVKSPTPATAKPPAPVAQTASKNRAPSPSKKIHTQ
jgi:hypothetical protein